MRISLLSPYPDIANYGLRTISSWLRQHGHQTQMIFIPDMIGEGDTRHTRKAEARYSEAVLDQVVERVRDADLVGITLMTHYFDSARQLTQAIKERLGPKPVIWGGFHPSVRPEECLHHADYVAVGEGEEIIRELCAWLERRDGTEPSDIQGLVWKRGEEMIRNPLGRLEQDLDRFPFPDWSLEDHWILRGERLLAATSGVIRETLASASVSQQFGRIGYQTMTGRGCPHVCTYCGNSFTRGLYKGQRYVRYRSVENVMQELEAVKRAFPFINLVWISDDSFFGRPLDDIRHFAREYKARVGDPTYMLGSPGTITEEKYEAMVDAGMLCCQVGIEHGSKRMQKLFHRTFMDNEKILATARIMAKYADRTAPPHYDVIYDSAYETLEDQLDTLRLVAQLPRPYRLQVFSLVYYPGTELHTMAMRDGLIHDEKAEIYDRMFFERHDSYANTLLFLSRTGRFPHSLLKVLTRSDIARFMTSKAMEPAGRAAKVTLSSLRKAKRHPAVHRGIDLGIQSLDRLREGRKVH